MKSTTLAALLIMILLGSKNPLLAQQDWSWVLGDSVLMRFPGGGAPVVDPVARTRYQFETGACISDVGGTLRLYANKDSIFSTNGTKVIGGRLFPWGETTNGLQILPMDGDSLNYLIFYISSSGICSTVCPGLVWVRAHPNQDTVISHRSLGQYDPVNYLSEKIASVKNAGGTGWWVFFHGEGDDKFIRFKVDGLSVSPMVIQSIGSVHGPIGLNPYYTIGEMCFSPKGDKLLAVTMTGVVDVFDFDRCTGQLSNWISLGTPAPVYPGQNVYYGCSFSADGTKIYVSEDYTIPFGNRIFQWDLSSGNIPNSKTLIYTAPDSVDLAQHQLGPDGKIYIAHLQQYDSLHPANFHLSVINDPNQSGAACNFTYNSLYLEGLRGTGHLPNLPNFNLAPLVAQNAQAGPPQVVLCAGDSVLLGHPDTTGGAVGYAWSGAGLADTTQPQQWVVPTATGWYYLTVTDSAVGIPCGVTRDSVFVIVADSNLFPVADAGPDLRFCLGDTLLLQAGPGNWDYIWSTGSDSSSAIVTQPGTYGLTVTNPVGAGACLADTDFVTVNVFPLLPLPAGLAGPDRILCPSDSVLIGSGAGLGFGYLWSLGVSPADTIPAWVADTGSFVLSIFNPDSLGGCFLGTDTVQVLPFDSLLLPPGFAGMDSTICLGDSSILGPGAWGLGPEWVGSWTPQGGGLLHPDSLSTLAWPSGTTTFILAATDTSNHGACATVRDTVLIVVEIPFVHPRPENQEFCPGEVLTVGVSSVSAFSYAWSPITGLNDPFVSATTVAPLTPIVYTLAVTSDTMISANCKTQYFTVALTSEGCIQQNVVTPNGDGINDFLVLGTFNGPIAVSVYDRWGSVIFSSNDYRGNWPLAGSDLVESVYWYVVRVANEGGKAFVGEVMVLR